MEDIIIENLPSKMDDAYFVLRSSNNLVFFGFRYFELFKAAINKDNFRNILGILAKQAMDENSDKITKDCYFDFCCGKFEFINYIPEWAKDVKLA
jgi:hypothetical protein